MADGLSGKPSPYQPTPEAVEAFLAEYADRQDTNRPTASFPELLEGFELRNEDPVALARHLARVVQELRLDATMRPAKPMLSFLQIDLAELSPEGQRAIVAAALPILAQAAHDAAIKATVHQLPGGDMPDVATGKGPAPRRRHA